MDKHHVHTARSVPLASDEYIPGILGSPTSEAVIRAYGYSNMASNLPERWVSARYSCLIF